MKKGVRATLLGGSGEGELRVGQKGRASQSASLVALIRIRLV